ncbi:MAG TPA: D-lyxose/D-mannose family sugar isomerase [Sphaerochaeta sp.]|nr:D-lyxose/D-mannose family sugar isomerase [Sphaerochaeta sp.]
MKRSTINTYIQEALTIFTEHHVHLPRWSDWSIDQWKENLSVCQEVLSTGLGWDITDFGSGNYDKRGLFLFTLRNGAPPDYAKPYAEKIMIINENQETPLHYHWEKQEDIINRAGGILVIELYRVGVNDELVSGDLTICIDGIRTHVKAGERVLLEPGQSITMPRSVYHRFYALEGHGYVLAGEVSSINDDDGDNRFHERLGRFPEREEDEAPFRLMIPDYDKFLNQE